ncbi:hypothetical protein BOTCAL_0566g00010 [Botryotinia calthae]|uniref:Uncharacterized protein n=1 Tax=Botryotinia calthae TaxID=38488 RepID=A0A4Y8CJP2_9HELO|nr:hypothetical protein BOTCAL_0566g00010 [Botryotinia calthae]
MTSRTPRWFQDPQHQKRDSRLISAAKKNSITIVTEILSDIDTTIDDTDHLGRTALHHAAELGLLEMVRVLLEHADPNIQDEFGCTPLFYAVTASSNGSDITELLSENYAKIDLRNRQGKTALYAALEEDKPVAECLFKEDKVTLLDAILICRRVDSIKEPTVRIVLFLLDHGVDVNVTDENGWNALHLACKKGNLAIVNLLRHHRFLSVQRTCDGRTALHIASQEGEEEIAEYLLYYFKVNHTITNERNWTPLHFAAKHGKIEVAKCLVKWHANLMALTRSGYNPVQIACIEGDDDLAYFLLECMKPDQIFLVQNTENHSILRIASSRGCIKVVDRILDHLRNQNNLLETLSELDQDCSVAYNAIEYGHEHIALSLLESGAKSDGVDAAGRNALHWAAQHGLTKVVNYLDSNDKKFKIKLGQISASGNSPLHCAAKALQTSILLCFLKRQYGIEAQPTDMDTASWTALHWAARYDRLDIVKLMVINHINIGEKDASGLRAADIVQKSSPQFVEMKEWLNPPERHPTMRSSPVSLSNPLCLDGAEDICKNAKAYIMAIFPKDVIVRTRFSIYNVLYEFGPERIISASADVYRIKDALEFKWIHLPANNDLTQAIYYDIAGKKLEKREDDKELRASRKLSKESLTSSSRSSSNRPLPTSHNMQREDIEDWKAHSSQALSYPGESRSVTYLEQSRDAPKEYFKVKGFVKDCLSRNAGSNSARYLQPFFKVFPQFWLESGNFGTTISFNDHAMMLNLVPDIIFLLHYNKASKRNGGGYGKVGESNPSFYERYSSHLQGIFRESKALGGTDDRVLRKIPSQLWVYVVDDETIITSCGTQWDDGSNLQTAISDHFIKDKETRPQISTALEMSVLVAALCARKSIDRELILGQDKQNLLHIFASAISSAADNKVRLFGEFMKSLDSDSHTDRNSMYDIRNEINLLKEVKDIQDELNIIKRVLTHQNQVLVDTFDFLDRQRPDGNLRESNHLYDVITYYRNLSSIEIVLAEMEKLIYDANEVHKNINHLLELRQKDANISEAKWARKESEDTTKQGKTILVFTIVTIIFLPITFFSSLFALDISSFPHDESGNLSYSPGWGFSRLLGITVAVSVPLIGLAFFVSEATEIFSRLRKVAKTERPILDRNGSSGGLELEITRHATTVATEKSEAVRSGPSKWPRRGLGAVRRVLAGKRGNEEAPINVSEA